MRSISPSRFLSGSRGSHMPMRSVSPSRISTGAEGSQMPMRGISPLRTSGGSTGSRMPMRSSSTPLSETMARGTANLVRTVARRYVMRHGGEAPEGGL
eukprot:1450935-Pyramimonas_sp.AAC.1